MKPISKYKLKPFALALKDQRQLKDDKAHFLMRDDLDSDAQQADAIRQIATSTYHWVEQPEFQGVQFSILDVHALVSKFGKVNEQNIAQVNRGLWKETQAQQLLDALAAYRSRLRTAQNWKLLSEVAIVENLLRMETHFPMALDSFWNAIPLTFRLLERELDRYSDILTTFAQLSERYTPSPYQPSWQVLACEQYCPPAELAQTLAQKHPLASQILSTILDSEQQRIIRRAMVTGLDLGLLTEAQRAELSAEPLADSKDIATLILSFVQKVSKSFVPLTLPEQVLEKLSALATDTDPTERTKIARDIYFILQQPKVDRSNWLLVCLYAEAIDVIAQHRITQPEPVDTPALSDLPSSAS